MPVENKEVKAVRCKL